MFNITYILLAIIALVIIIDLYLKNKNKLANTKDIEKVVANSDLKNRLNNRTIKIFILFLIPIIIGGIYFYLPFTYYNKANDYYKSNNFKDANTELEKIRKINKGHTKANNLYVKSLIKESDLYYQEAVRIAVESNFNDNALNNSITKSEKALQLLDIANEIDLSNSKIYNNKIYNYFHIAKIKDPDYLFMDILTLCIARKRANISIKNRMTKIGGEDFFYKSWNKEYYMNYEVEDYVEKEGLNLEEFIKERKLTKVNECRLSSYKEFEDFYYNENQREFFEGTKIAEETDSLISLCFYNSLSIDSTNKETLKLLYLLGEEKDISLDFSDLRVDSTFLCDIYKLTNIKFASDLLSYQELKNRIPQFNEDEYIKYYLFAQSKGDIYLDENINKSYGHLKDCAHLSQSLLYPKENKRWLTQEQINDCEPQESNSFRSTFLGERCSSLKYSTKSLKSLISSNNFRNQEDYDDFRKSFYVASIYYSLADQYTTNKSKLAYYTKSLKILEQKFNSGLTNYEIPSKFFNDLKPIIGHTIPWKNDFDYLITNINNLLFDIALIQGDHYKDPRSALSSYESLLKYFKIQNREETTSAANVYYGLFMNKWNIRPYGDKMGACEDLKKAADLNNEIFYNEYLNSGCN